MSPFLFSKFSSPGSLSGWTFCREVCLSYLPDAHCVSMPGKKKVLLRHEVTTSQLYVYTFQKKSRDSKAGGFESNFQEPPPLPTLSGSSNTIKRKDKAPLALNFRGRSSGFEEAA